MRCTTGAIRLIILPDSAGPTEVIYLDSLGDRIRIAIALVVRYRREGIATKCGASDKEITVRGSDRPRIASRRALSLT